MAQTLAICKYPSHLLARLYKRFIFIDKLIRSVSLIEKTNHQLVHKNKGHAF